jgi:hypothetical protein
MSAVLHAAPSRPITAVFALFHKTLDRDWPLFSKKNPRAQEAASTRRSVRH